MRHIHFLWFAFSLFAQSFAAGLLDAQDIRSAEPEVVSIWPDGKMPGKASTEPETEKPAKGDDVTRITNISRPTLTLFPVAKRPAPFLIVCPGGGYNYVVVDKEGAEIANWLNSLGYGAAVLKYRVPNNREGALQDIQRAIRLARAHAEEWNVDPRRLGVIGFSAGGNLSAKASCPFDEPTYSPLDDVDGQSSRPDFAALVYPAYLERDGKLAADLNLRANIPPTLIVHTEDDAKFIAGSKLYDAALTESHLPHKFVLYATGGHGYGLRCTKEARAWPAAAKDWLRETVGE